MCENNTLLIFFTKINTMYTSGLPTNHKKNFPSLLLPPSQLLEHDAGIEVKMIEYMYKYLVFDFLLKKMTACKGARHLVQ